MHDSHQQLFLKLSGKTYPVTRFCCRNEAISAHYRCSLSFTSTERLETAIGQSVCLNIQNTRYLHGLISSWNHYGKIRGLYTYQLDLASPLQTLEHRCDKNYVHQTASDIIHALLQKNNLADYTITLTKHWPLLKFVAQYQKSDLWLFEYLLQKSKAFYVWEQTKEKAVLCILDDKAAIASLFTAKLLPDQPFSTGINNAEVVFKKSCSKLANGKELYFFETNCSTVFPGQILHLSTPELLYNKSFRILTIEHRGEQLPDTLNAEQQALLYQNKLICMAASQDFLKKPRKQIFLKTLTAHTTTQDKQVLDSQGYYYLKFSYDADTITPAFQRSQDFNGNQIAGMHFPLRQNAWVLTGFINDKINTPVILGQIPTQQQPSPVTRHNPYQYIIRTAEQSQWILDDQAKSITLNNPSNSLYFHQKGMTFQSHQGEIQIANAQSYSLNAGLDYTIHTKANYQQTFQQASLIATKQGGIKLQASHQLTIQAKQALRIQSQQIRIEAKNTIEFLVTNQLLNIQDSLQILVLEQLLHLANTTKIRTCKQLQINESITLQPNSLDICAQSVTINAESIKVYQDSQINH